MNGHTAKLPSRLPLKIPKGEPAESVLHNSGSVQYDMAWIPKPESLDENNNHDVDLRSILNPEN